MLTTWMLWTGVLGALFLFISVGLGVWIYYKYLPVLARIFEERPFLVTEEVSGPDGAEEVVFQTKDGLTLRGSFWRSPVARSRGQVVFCHEFLSNRWSAVKYCTALRDAGFDVFTFDFRNHGSSDCLLGYEPLQWVTEYEVTDVCAALEYVKKRLGDSSIPIGLYGISRGGGAAICAASRISDSVAVITDGAFPTAGTQLFYINRWARIFTKAHSFYAHLPSWYYRLVASATSRHVGRKRRCKFVSIERALRRLRFRRQPILMIHGDRDTFIDPEIVKELLRYTHSNATLWLVANAKHNQCVHIAINEYRKRVVGFFSGSLGPYLESESRKTIQPEAVLVSGEEQSF